MSVHVFPATCQAEAARRAEEARQQQQEAKRRAAAEEARRAAEAEEAARVEAARLAEVERLALAGSGKQVVQEGSGEAEAPPPRKRGRPKGSKNAPKPGSSASKNKFLQPPAAASPRSKSALRSDLTTALRESPLLAAAAAAAVAEAPAPKPSSSSKASPQTPEAAPKQKGALVGSAKSALAPAKAPALPSAPSAPRTLRATPQVGVPTAFYPSPNSPSPFLPTLSPNHASSLGGQRKGCLPSYCTVAPLCNVV